MSTKKKLLLKARNTPGNFKFSELETLLSQHGFMRAKTNAGSHLKWIHPEKYISYGAPYKNPMKAIYIKALLRMLNEHFYS